MLERRSVVGGAAVTDEFHPGFRNAATSDTVSLLNPRALRVCVWSSMGWQHAHPPLNGGRDARREAVAKLMIDTSQRWAPNFRRSVRGPEQLFSARPLLGQGNIAARFRGSIFAVPAPAPVAASPFCRGAMHPARCCAMPGEGPDRAENDFLNSRVLFCTAA